MNTSDSSYAWGGTEIFVSYASRENAGFKEPLVAALRALGFRPRVYEDETTDPKNYTRLEDFMASFDQGFCAVLIIGREYTRSRYCMRELQVVHRGLGPGLIFPVMLHPFDPTDEADRLEVVRFWRQKQGDLRGVMQNVDPKDVEEASKTADMYGEFGAGADKWLAELAGLVRPSVDPYDGAPAAYELALKIRERAIEQVETSALLLRERFSQIVETMRTAHEDMLESLFGSQLGSSYDHPLVISASDPYARLDSPATGEAVDLLSKTVLGNEPACHVIFGEPGAGKSTVLRKVARALLNAEGRLVLYVDLGDDELKALKWTDPSAVKQNLFEYGRALFPSYARDLGHALRAYSQLSAHMVLLVDGLDQLGRKAERAFKAIAGLVDDFGAIPAFAGAVIATRPMKLSQPTWRYDLPPLGQDDRRAILSGWVRALDCPVDEVVVESIACKASFSTPLSLSHAARLIVHDPHAFDGQVSQHYLVLRYLDHLIGEVDSNRKETISRVLSSIAWTSFTYEPRSDRLAFEDCKRCYREAYGSEIRRADFDEALDVTRASGVTVPNRRPPKFIHDEYRDAYSSRWLIDGYRRASEHCRRELKRVVRGWHVRRFHSVCVGVFMQLARSPESPRDELTTYLEQCIVEIVGEKDKLGAGAAFGVHLLACGAVHHDGLAIFDRALRAVCVNPQLGRCAALFSGETYVPSLVRDVRVLRRQPDYERVLQRLLDSNVLDEQIASEFVIQMEDGVR